MDAYERPWSNLDLRLRAYLVQHRGWAPEAAAGLWDDLLAFTFDEPETADRCFYLLCQVASRP